MSFFLSLSTLYTVRTWYVSWDTTVGAGGFGFRHKSSAPESAYIDRYMRRVANERGNIVIWVSSIILFMF